MRPVAKLRYVAALAVSALISTAPAWGETINASNESTIEYRQNIMKTKGAQAAAIGQVLALMVPDGNLASHFEALLLATRQTKLAFTPKVQGGDALPAIWEKWDDFSARLAQAEENLVKAVETARKHSGTGSLGEDAIAAMNSCKDCHDVYRKKK